MRASSFKRALIGAALWVLAVFTTLYMLLVLSGVLGGCAPITNGMIYGGTGPGRPSYPLALVLHNQDIAYPESLTVTWWVDSTVTGTETRVAPAGGEVTFSLWCPNAYHPTGFMVVGTAWPTGNTWGYPDYQGTDIFHVNFPTGATWRQP